MTRQTCSLSSRHVLCLISVISAAFLIQSNESLIPTWGKRCVTSQAVSGSMLHYGRGGNCLRTSFFRFHKSSTAVAGSGDEDSQDSPVYFFADKETDESDDSAEEQEAEKIPSEEEAAKERAAAEQEAAKARQEEIKRQADLEEEIKLADEERERLLNEVKEKATGAFQAVEKAIKPFTEIQDGVSEDRIKGAAIAATALTFLVSKGVVASGAVGLSAAYISISKSVAGDFLRQVGEVTWDATEAASQVAGKIGSFPTFGEVDRKVENKYKRPKSKNDVDEGELAFIEAEDDDDLARVLKEAETVISEADAAIAKAEAEQKEKVETSIQEILTEINEVAESEEEVEKLSDEGEDKDVEENDSITYEEDAEDVEEDDVFVDEDEDLEEDDSSLHEDEGEDPEENDSSLFDDDQFMAAVELAQEGIEGKIVGVDDIITDEFVKAEWDAAGELASELRQDVDTSTESNVDEDDVLEDIDLEFGDIDVEALGRAAREAVETFETQQQELDEALLDEKQQWADSMIEDDGEDDDFDLDGDDLFSAESLDAARAAVEASLGNADDVNTMGEFASKDWSSLKVVELREELKRRGLKTSGKKADLVSLLEESDLSDFDEDEESMISEDDEDEDDDEIVDIDDFDIEELGRQARAAVEMFQTSVDGFDEEPTEEMLAELESEMAINGEFIEERKPSADISKMTVAQLKDECRNRGLKVGGRKAELIERLKNSTD